jgi:hypothetical protein
MKITGRTMKLVEKWEAEGQYTVYLHQHAPNRFRVAYGLEVYDKLTYAQASKKLGEALMHSLACAGKIAIDCKPEPYNG